MYMFIYIHTYAYIYVYIGPPDWMWNKTLKNEYGYSTFLYQVCLIYDEVVA
jgi:hypothetical protein